MFDTASEDLMVRCSVVAVTEAVQQLAKRLTGLIAKRPGLVVGIWGEPGIGKTHTVKGLLRETPCRNLSLHATTNPTELARALPRPTKLPAWAERTFERVTKGEHLETVTLTDAIGATLNGLAPFVLHLEDVHEASAGQLEFIQALAKIVLRLKSVGLIVTSREQPPEGFETIRLEPLSSQTVQEMLKAEVSADLPTEALDWIQTRAAGNPLFSLEFFRFLSRQGFVWSDGQKWRWRTPNLEIMPTTVEVLIEHITAKAMLNPKLEIVIQAKAFLGRSVQLQLWAEVVDVPLEILEESKIELEHEGILLGHEFAHPLYAEIIARNLTVEKRQSLARRAIDALEHDPMAAAVFVKDAKFESEVTYQWFKFAIQIISATGNDLKVARLQAQAMPYAPSDERGLLALESASCLRLIDVTEATRLAKIAILNLPNNTQSIDLMSHLLAGQGKVAEAEHILEQLPEAEQSGDRTLIRLISLRSLAQDHKAVIELWRLHPEIHAIQNPKILYSVAFAMSNHAMYTEAEAITSRMLSSKLENEDRCQFIGILGTIRYYQNDYAQAELLYSEALKIASKAHRDDYVAVYLSNRASTRGQQGKLNEQIKDLKESIKIYEKSGNLISVIRLKVQFADAFLDCGDYEHAEDFLLESRAALGIIELTDVFIECEYRLSQLYRDWGIPNGGILAIRHAHAALKYAQQAANPMKIAWCLCYAATAEARFGNAALSEKLASEALLLATQLGSRGQIGMARFAHGLALEASGQRDKSLLTLQELEVTLREQTFVDPAHEVGLEVDRLSNNLTSAAERLKWFEMNGQTNLANIARRYFPNLATDIPQDIQKPFQAKLEVFGSIQFVTANSSIPVRGQKRRELLALLLEARISGRKEVSRLELLDVLYPNTDELQAGTLLKDVVYQVREIGDSNSIVTTENGYALGEVISDAEIFLETGNTQLWRGAYLDGLNLERNNDTVRETLHLALRSYGENLLETNPTEAVRVGRLLIAADSYDLEALRLTLNALRILQNHKTLSRLYTKAREGLLEIGEVLPMRWQDFLETQIGVTA